ncbi:MAG: hypothetical protein WCO26_03435 [Deltaproteobacteria bacterium]
MENEMEIVKWSRYFALYDQGELVCVTVYKKGAQEVRRRIEELKSMVEMATMSPQNGEASQGNQVKE